MNAKVKVVEEYVREDVVEQLRTLPPSFWESYERDHEEYKPHVMLGWVLWWTLLCVIVGVIWAARKYG